MTLDLDHLRPTDYWQTPPELLEKIVGFLGPNDWADPCPSDPSIDGLRMVWGRTCYINPPFSQYLKWAEYGKDQFDRLFHDRPSGARKPEFIWMCNHDHSTKWFKLLMQNASAICMLGQRVRFINPATGQPGRSPAWPNTLIYWGDDYDGLRGGFRDTFKDIGIVR